MADQTSKAKAWPGDAARAAVYWQGGDPRWQLRDMVPLTTTERADVCIVGGGFTGLWTALSIKRLAPVTDVVLAYRAIGEDGEDRHGLLGFGAEGALEPETTLTIFLLGIAASHEGACIVRLDFTALEEEEDEESAEGDEEED